MSFLLDTNIISAMQRGARGVAHRLIQHSGRIHTSEIVVAEIYAGIHHRLSDASYITLFEEFLGAIQVHPFDRECALAFGRLRGELLRTGRPVNPVDLMIAATAVVHNLTLVTHNVKDFEQVPDVRFEDWLEA